MTPDERDDWARRSNWLILLPGEAYEKRLSDSGSMFIFMTDSGRWNTLYHRSGWNGQPDKRTYKAQEAKWEKALTEAESMVKFMDRGRKKTTNE